MTQSADIFVAKESFATDYEGSPIIVKAGQTRVRKGHPLLKKHSQFFEPLEIHYDVEQATAKPGESRGAPAQIAAPAAEPAKASDAEKAEDKKAEDKKDK